MQINTFPTPARLFADSERAALWADSFRKLFSSGSKPLPGQKPSRGAFEVKPASDDAWVVADGSQVAPPKPRLLFIGVWNGVQVAEKRPAFRGRGRPRHTGIGGPFFKVKAVGCKAKETTFSVSMEAGHIADFLIQKCQVLQSHEN